MSRSTPEELTLSSLAVVGLAKDGPKKRFQSGHTARRDSRPLGTAVGPALRWQSLKTRAEDAGRRSSSADSSLRRRSARRLRADAGRCADPRFQMRPVLETPFLNFLSFEARPGLVITSSWRETPHLCHVRERRPFFSVRGSGTVFCRTGRIISDLGQQHHVALFSDGSRPRLMRKPISALAPKKRVRLPNG